jgi:hypothetical protein
MPTSVGPNPSLDSNIVFSYDTGDTSNSYRGQPTTNTMRQSNNVTGTQYGYNNEYDTCQLVKTWNPSLKTPIGTGATLLTEQNSGNSPWYGLNWFDDSEDGKRCLSAYIYPVNSVTQLRFGMVGDSSNSVFFNLVTRAITYGAGISNTNAFIQDVPGYPGWLRVGANIEGRSGGWVAFLGTGFESYYTPSTPYQSFYACGIQYERNIAPHCTQFTPAETTRSATQGLLPLISNTSINLSSVSFNSNAQIVYDGTDDRIDLGNLGTIGTTYTIECIFNSSNVVNYKNVFDMNYETYPGVTGNVGPRLEQYSDGTITVIWSGNTTNNSIAVNTPVTPISANTNYHMVFTQDGNNGSIYLNGTYKSQNSNTYGYVQTFADANLGRGFYFDNRYFAGTLPIFKIYNIALSANQVKQNYQQYKTRFNLS